MKSCINRYVILILTLSLMTVGCKELYYPEIEPAHTGIAVDGMITTGPGPHHIWLSHTSLFHSNEVAPPLEGAIVFVHDDQSRAFQFEEKRPGYYESSAAMPVHEGGIYTLHIETPDGHIYKSTPQEMPHAFQIDSMLAADSKRTTTYEANNGRLVVRETPGVDALLALRDHEGNPANVRFETHAKLLYEYEFIPPGFPASPAKAYCWKYMTRFEGIENFNMPTASNQPGDVSHNVVGFLPNENMEYGISNYYHLQALAVEVRLYAINNEAYSYYHDVYKQITSDGSIFSPVPSQMTTNIFCETDPGRIAVGLFEVSALSRQTYVLRRPPYVLHFEPTNRYYAIPATAACSVNEIPPFWIY